jgi:hypothetical protein
MTHTSLPRSICVCEPLCMGFEHALVNTAILHTVLFAFPEASVTFTAEAEHCQRVHANLTRIDPSNAPRVQWKTIAIPPRTSSTRQRLPFEYRTLREIFNITAAEHAEFLFFSSASELGLFALKTFILSHRPPVKVMAMLHNVLTSFETVRRKPFSRFRGLPAVFALPQPANLRYIALGDSIFNHLKAVAPGAARFFDILDLPHEWGASSPVSLPADESPRFGFLGVSRGKGFQTFARVVDGVRAVEPSARFSLVGHLNSPEDCSRYSRITEDAECEPLSDDEYRRRGLALTYAVWTADPEHYGLVASATFLDTLSLVKPCIYLRNPYIDSYASRMGVIGYGCTSVQEMQEVIISLIRSFPAGRYREQCATILRTRDIFSPRVLGERLRSHFLAWKL